jgi:hypothetical protein
MINDDFNRTIVGFILFTKKKYLKYIIAPEQGRIGKLFRGAGALQNTPFLAAPKLGILLIILLQCNGSSSKTFYIVFRLIFLINVNEISRNRNSLQRSSFVK